MLGSPFPAGSLVTFVEEALSAVWLLQRGQSLWRGVNRVSESLWIPRWHQRPPSTRTSKRCGGAANRDAGFVSPRSSGAGVSVVSVRSVVETLYTLHIRNSADIVHGEGNISSLAPM